MTFRPTADAILEACRPTVLARASGAVPDAIALDPGLVAMFCNYLLLTECPEVLADRGVALGQAAIAHERYYWFLRFVRTAQEVHGFDAGMEQQAFHLLAETPHLWEADVITAIESLVAKDVARPSSRS